MTLSVSGAVCPTPLAPSYLIENYALFSLKGVRLGRNLVLGTEHIVKQLNKIRVEFYIELCMLLDSVTNISVRLLSRGINEGGSSAALLMASFYITGGSPAGWPFLHISRFGITIADLATKVSTVLRRCYCPVAVPQTNSVNQSLSTSCTSQPPLK